MRALGGVVSTETFPYLEMWKQLYDWGAQRRREATHEHAGRPEGGGAAQAARDHLWLHFTRMGGYEPPIIVRGEGCYLEDDEGQPLPRRARRASSPCRSATRYGEEIGQAALEQMRELPFYTNW